MWTESGRQAAPADEVKREIDELCNRARELGHQSEQLVQRLMKTIEASARVWWQ